ncbi:Rossmann-like and DUF2520 domain-containing protein [Alicyclobacillus ferrooxydans]|uniref:Rossmann-like and DUF2520 domain-containing protein n=1 Tax=Alicyclobacillus ferrooxydans TaxID=471514 RepID=UPI0006D5313C|nr:Rossmann-like and DUF2520 domain-containing protein [Alicyclobacillus ferrooxydans]
MQQVVVIGCGRVGTTMALALMSAGYDVTAGLARQSDSPSALQFAGATGVGVFHLKSEEAIFRGRSADVIFITTPDKAVTETAQTLVEQDMVHEGQVVIHTSGALTSDALAPVRSKGATALSLHPLQTIAAATVGQSILKGAYCTLEGDPSAVEVGNTLVRVWGGIPAIIDASLRPRYHAAAVLASNAVVALAAVAAQLSGLPDGLQALLPLLKGAVKNLETLGLPNALTGPVERGDVLTVQAHMAALQHNPTAQLVYAAMGKATADLAQEKGTLSHPMWQSFTALFMDQARESLPTDDAH